MLPPRHPESHPNSGLAPRLTLPRSPKECPTLPLCLDCHPESRPDSPLPNTGPSATLPSPDDRPMLAVQARQAWLLLACVTDLAYALPLAWTSLFANAAWLARCCSSDRRLPDERPSLTPHPSPGLPLPDAVPLSGLPDGTAWIVTHPTIYA